MIEVIDPGKRKGRVSVPPSKSDSQRAILAAALSKGVSILSNVGQSNDEKAMLSAIRDLGAEISIIDQKTIQIKGIENFPKTAVLTIGESGLALRLLSMVCAAHKGTYTLKGKGSLLKRSMNFIIEILPKFKTVVKSNENKLPLTITGPMKARKLKVDGSESSQYISGLMIALPLLKETTYLEVVNLKSKPYLQMTLDTLASFGVLIEHKDLQEFIIGGNQKYLSTNYKIESDWSSASYWLVASALGADVKVSGLRMSSLQADKKLLSALISAGCVVNHVEEGISIEGQNRQPFEFDATDCPDLFPALVTFAAFIVGKSRIKGVNRLVNKESDRGKTLQKEFKKLNVKINIIEDDMIIHGTGKVNGGVVSSHRDHRIAMCLAIAGLFSESSVEIKNPEAVAKSYPDFWKDLANLTVVL